MHMLREGAMGALLLVFVSTSYVAAESAEQIDAKLHKLAEKVRSVMPTGIPSKGLQSLDPFHEKAYTRHLALNKGTDIKVEASGITVTKHKAFKIVSIKTTLNPLTTRLEVYVPSVNIKAEKYTLKGVYANDVQLSGSGEFEIEVEDVKLVIVGSVDLAVPSISKQFTLNVSVGKVKVIKMTGTNALVTEMVEEKGKDILATPQAQATAHDFVSQHHDLFSNYLKALAPEL